MNRQDYINGISTLLDKLPNKLLRRVWLIVVGVSLERWTHQDEDTKSC